MRTAPSRNLGRNPRRARRAMHGELAVIERHLACLSSVQYQYATYRMSELDFRETSFSFQLQEIDVPSRQFEEE